MNTIEFVVVLLSYFLLFYFGVNRKAFLTMRYLFSAFLKSESALTKQNTQQRKKMEKKIAVSASISSVVIYDLEPTIMGKV